MRTNLHRAGDAAEERVAKLLVGNGWTILERQLHVGHAELDIVAIDPGPPAALVVVEVRWRGRRDFGLGEETVDWRKQNRLRQAAFRWVEATDAPRRPLRFDLVAVEPSRDGRGEPVLRHHRAAF
jgi:putative endonuclease